MENVEMRCLAFRISGRVSGWGWLVHISKTRASSYNFHQQSDLLAFPEFWECIIPLRLASWLCGPLYVTLSWRLISFLSLSWLLSLFYDPCTCLLSAHSEIHPTNNLVVSFLLQASCSRDTDCESHRKLVHSIHIAVTRQCTFYATSAPEISSWHDIWDDDKEWIFSYCHPMTKEIGEKL